MPRSCIIGALLGQLPVPTQILRKGLTRVLELACYPLPAPALCTPPPGIPHERFAGYKIVHILLQLLKRSATHSESIGSLWVTFLSHMLQGTTDFNFGILFRHLAPKSGGTLVPQQGNDKGTFCLTYGA